MESIAFVSKNEGFRIDARGVRSAFYDMGIPVPQKNRGSCLYPTQLPRPIPLGFTLSCYNMVGLSLRKRYSATERSNPLICP